MSKLVDATITCPHCGKEYPVKLFRTIWGEQKANRALVFNDEINVLKCPHCGHSFKASFPFMYVDVEKGFAVWWEPEYDPGIDLNSKDYAKIFGVNSYYATAPRIADWEEFKKVIQEYYQGKRVGGSIEKMNIGTLKRNTASQKKNGCLGTFAMLFVTIVSVIGIACYEIYQMLI